MIAYCQPSYALWDNEMVSETFTAGAEPFNVGTISLTQDVDGKSMWVTFELQERWKQMARQREDFHRLGVINMLWANGVLT